MNPFNRFISWFFKKRAIPYWGILMVDCTIFIFSALFVMTLNNGPVYVSSHFWPVLKTILFYLIFYVVGIGLFRTYSGVIRFSSFVDLQRVGAAVLFGLIISLAARQMLNLNEVLTPIRARDIILFSFLSLVLMWGIRVLVKILYDSTFRVKNATRIFIYGVKEGGVSIAKSVRNQSPQQYYLAGFISDDDDMKGKVLMGVNVYPNDENVVDKMIHNKATALFVSPMKSEALRENNDLVNSLINAGIKIFMVPSECEWDGKNDIAHTSMREIEIEDLLPRKKIDVDMDAIGKLLTGTKILITGAAGSIGSEMVRQIAVYSPAELVLIDQAETPLHDIRLMMSRDFPDIKAKTIVTSIVKRDRMEEIFRETRPEYVFHAAAYKHVPMMEDNPGESIHNNIEGTRVIADLAVKYGTKIFVMISTDKAVNPTNVMGCSKRICEIYVQSLDKAEKEGLIKGSTQFVTTRFGNVLGSNGSVIPLFKEQIKKGGPITVTHPDIIRYFMLIPEACKLVLEAGTMGHGGEIFVFDMGEPVKIVDLAKRMIQLSGADIEIKFTGLRFGEKLYEEVLNEKETTLPTFHPKIKIAKVREYDYVAVNDAIGSMVESCYIETSMQVVARMKKIVPEFRSQNSVYEILDK